MSVAGRSYDYLRRDGKEVLVCMYNFIAEVDPNGKLELNFDPEKVREHSLNLGKLVSLLAKPDSKVIRLSSDSFFLDDFREALFAGDPGAAKVYAKAHVFALLRTVKKTRGSLLEQGRED